MTVKRFEQSQTEKRYINALIIIIIIRKYHNFIQTGVYRSISHLLSDGTMLRGMGQNMIFAYEVGSIGRLKRRCSHTR